MDFGIIYNGQNNSELSAYMDADWGADPTDWKSISGYIFMMGNGPIAWRSKKQLTVALSSMEAEYMALVQAAQEAIWLQTLTTELEIGPKGPITIHSDNQAALAHARNEMITQRTKHIDIKYHFIHDVIAKGEIA